jgi:trehalose 6-phosphate synthase
MAPVTWLASPASDADRMLAIADHEAPLGSDSSIRFVDIPEDAYHLFYEVFCNPILWFIQHGIDGSLKRDLRSAETWRAWELGYRRVNELYADAVVAQLRGASADRVMLHDYHFYLTPQMVRAQCPSATLQHFIHIPWPAAHLWEALPRHMVAAMCRGLLGNDSLVFQTDESVENFFSTCAIYLRDEAAVAPVPGEVRYGGHTTSVWSNPISVDARELREQVSSAAADEYRERLQREIGERTIVRVDRLDPGKDVVSGFRAFERLLEQHPEWTGKVRFLAFLVPSRTSIPEYRVYEEETFAVVESINSRFARDNWQPIKLYHEHNRRQALVALTMYDVLLVNSLADGMNLVSKEGPVLNERDGVLVLSEGAGSHEELRCGAVSVKPGDIDRTAEALDQALRMEPSERSERSRTLKECIERHQIQDWLRLQLKDLTITEYVKGIARSAARYRPASFAPFGG